MGHAEGRLDAAGTRPAGGVVAAAHPLAAAAGAAILAQGGHAVDAAVATAAVLSVVEPFGSGLGGGGFLICYDASHGATTVLDARETAPAAATPDMFLDPTTGQPYPRAVVGMSGLSVGVPGQAACWEEALRRWGRCDLATALAPAIRLAREGFPVTAYFVAEVTAQRRRLQRHPATARRFLPGGRPPPVGWRLVQPELAASLELLAAEGAAGFAACVAPAIAAALADAHAALPGRLAPADVTSYRVRVGPPARGQYRGHTILAPPPPSGGPTLLQALHLLEAFDLPALAPHAPRAIHLLSEALRLAEADRVRWIGDPAYAPVPLATLLSRAYATARRRLIAPDRAGAHAAVASSHRVAAPRDAADAAREAAGTTHLSVIDAAGNAVAYTATLGTHFGAGITVPGYGFLLNNTLRNFRFDPRGAASPNLPAPGKRPRSSIAPALVFGPDGALHWALGAAGAAWIVPAVAQLVVALVDWGLPPQAAVDAGRAMPDTATGALLLEAALFDGQPGLVAALARLGHRVARAPGARGAAQLVGFDPASGGCAAAADWRRDGAVAWANAS